jgi:hypothetical protein
MAEENYEPDWNGWLLVTDVIVEAAVALSLNVDPRRLLAWQMLKNRTQPAEIIKFQDRVYWVEQWKLRGPNWVRENYEGGTRTIYLREFAQRAKAARWKVPPPLLTLIEAENGDRAETQLKTPSEEEKVESRQAPERPAKISDKAWERFCDAHHIDPGFCVKRGGITTAARRIARKEGTEMDLVRRDLNRVLKARRGQFGQK